MKPKKKTSRKHTNQAETIKSRTKIEIGQTLESNDIHLPHKKNKKPISKNRPVIVVDKNKYDELVIVPGSTQDTPNTTYYGKYGIKYYRHNIEIVDNKGEPIREGPKFKKTSRCSKLPFEEAKRIRDNVINHTKFASDNKSKYDNFWHKKRKN